MTARQSAIQLARATRLLPLAERVRFAQQTLRSRSKNRRFVAEHPGEPMPPRWLSYDAFGLIDYSMYWNSGAVVASYLADLATSYLDHTPASICDWGCGPARVVRHLASTHRDVFDRVIGTDYNAGSIEWGREHFPDVELHLNGLEPPLPFSDGEIDLVFSRSVFTHLSEERQHAWIAELARVVRPGGLIVFTTHGDRFADKLLPHEVETYRSSGIVERAQVKEGARAFVSFTSPAWVRHSLLTDLEVVAHVTDAPEVVSTGQDIWITRTP